VSLARRTLADPLPDPPRLASRDSLKAGQRVNSQVALAALARVYLFACSVL
jgi:hypothetical protein